MSSPVLPSSSASGASQQGTLLWLLGLLLVLAPLYRAGNRPLPSLVLELGALMLLVAVFWSPPRDLVGRSEAFALGVLVVFPLLYLVPLPGGVVAQWLPGRELYAAGMSLLGLDPADVAASVAIVPFAAESSWLSLLVPVAAFIATRALPTRRLLQLVMLLLVIAAVEAALGLMQLGQEKGSPLYWGMTFSNFGTAVGTYANHNHLAGLLEMVLPISLALLIYSIGRGSEGRASAGWRGRAVFYSTLRGHAAVRYGMLSLLLLVGLIFTRSRTGVALAILGILLVTFALSRRIGGENVRAPIKTIVALALGIGVSIGLVPVIDRFTSLDPFEDSRWGIFSATIHGIGALFPFGSGPGGYVSVFSAFQPVDLSPWRIDYAHNDYLQWLFEGGLFAGLLILLLVGLYLVRWRRIWTQGAWSRFRFVQVGAGIGLFLLMLHELVDYNLRIPANILYFAFLAGVFFADADEETAMSRRKRRRRTPDLDIPSSPEGAQPVLDTINTAPRGPMLDQIKHPFAD